ncbi:ATP-binding protein [Burkholderia vietnamiensis]|uniref:ATP-binding protein n=1 Tax=Burkholderia vietnamiensis TaxID=60552 RepID=UPI0009BEC776|nr:ATP-binding protein [Burkholderia vietnamiensis]
MMDNKWAVNPLLASLPLPVDFDTLPELLLNEPLSFELLGTKSPQERAHLLAKIGSHFVPTSTAIDIADAILVAIYAGYEERNPCLAEVKKRRYLVGGWQGSFRSGGPAFAAKNVRCVTIEGITGLGKSTIVDRTLSLLPQVVIHGPSESAGWTMQKQLVWVKVDMTSDGSRLGFLMQLYQQIDAALGTDYFSQFSAKRWPIEQHMVSVAKILYNCFCGALVIEEIQARNFAEAASRNVMLLFFLRLANLGIPIVLIGNPLGFEGFADFSQDVRRLSSGGRFELWPALSPQDDDWAEFLVPGMLQFNVMSKPPAITHAAELLFKCTGGVYDFLAKLLAQAQLLALRRGQECIYDADLLDAYDGATITASHNLIRALVERNEDALRQFSDIPSAAFGTRWVAMGGLRTSLPGGKVVARAPVTEVLKSSKKRRPRFQVAERMYKQKVASEKRRGRQDSEKQQQLPQEDLRSRGLRSVLLDNFETMRRRRERSKS